MVRKTFLFRVASSLNMISGISQDFRARILINENNSPEFRRTRTFLEQPTPPVSEAQNGIVLRCNCSYAKTAEIIKAVAPALGDQSRSVTGSRCAKATLDRFIHSPCAKKIRSPLELPTSC
jgi:hypothetical protein